jgi:HEAT repeat protein
MAPLRRLAERGPRELARVAERELWRRQRPQADGTKLPVGLGLAEDEEALGTFDTFWESFDDLPAPRRTEWGWQLRNVLPDFDRQLRWRLAASDAADRARGVRMVRALSLAEDMREQLYVLAYDADPLVRSAAVMALARVDNPTTRRILWTALRDPDERVQANAVEALDSLEAEQFRGDVQNKLQSPNNRVRANAIKSLLKLEVHEAADTLLAMLAAESRADRLSALWVIECLQLQSVTDRLVAMARGDPDPRVRHRAVAVARRIGVPVPIGEPVGTTEDPSS